MSYSQHQPNPFERPIPRVKLKDIELFHSICDEHGNQLDFKTVDGRLIFNHLRHRCTNYEDVINELRQKYDSNHVPDDVYAVIKTRAADVIIEEYRDRYIVVAEGLEKETEKRLSAEGKIREQENAIASFCRKVGVSTLNVAIETLDSMRRKIATLNQIQEAYLKLEIQYEDTLEKYGNLESTHENSRTTFGRYNDAYKVNERLTIEYLKLKEVEPEIVDNLEMLYKKKSPNTAIPVFCEFSGQDESETLKRMKKFVRYTKLTSQEN